MADPELSNLRTFGRSLQSPNLRTFEHSNVLWNMRPTMLAFLGLYCLFILYGSFIPFRFTTDPEIVRQHLSSVQVYPFQDGKKKFSIPDMASNALLFMPFGALLVVSRVTASTDRVRISSIILGGLIAAAFATTIELGQLFSLARTASLLDVEANTAGAVIGASAAYFLFPSASGRFSGWVRALRQQPAILPLGLVALSLIADRFYPFAITLDVSTAWHGLTHVQWHPFGSFDRRFWGNVVMDTAVNFAFLAALLHHVSERRWPGVQWAGTVWLTAIFFAGSLEAGKLFFVGRYPNVDNVILAAAGALAGVTLVPLISRWKPVKAHPGRALLVLAIALLVYAELTPFDFALTPSAVAAKTLRIEWLPLASYYGADPQTALFDLWNKLLLSGFLGFSVCVATRKGLWEAAIAGLIVGGFLESAQILTVARIPSVSDVLIFGVGACIGGTAYKRQVELAAGSRQRAANS